GLFAVVPLTVLIGGVAFADGEVGAADLCTKMGEGAEVSASMGPPDQFAADFAALRERGAEAGGVVSMSAALSGTRVSSRLDVDSIAGTVADWCAGETRTVFAPSSLEYLRRGGRIGAASSLLGRALQIVPVLGLSAGVVIPLARVRTRTKALEKIVALTANAADEISETSDAVRVEVQQAEGDIDDADVTTLITRLTELGFATSFRTLSTIITAHVGPGTIGVTVQTEP